MDSIEIIKLGQYGKSMGTRALGKEIREKVVFVINSGGRVFFDFTDVSVISSAFADELFGKLYNELGENIFKKSIKINNFENEGTKRFILAVINKSINFRRQPLDEDN